MAECTRYVIGDVVQTPIGPRFYLLGLTHCREDMCPQMEGHAIGMNLYQFLDWLRLHEEVLCIRDLRFYFIYPRYEADELFDFLVENDAINQPEYTDVKVWCVDDLLRVGGPHPDFDDLDRDPRFRPWYLNEYSGRHAHGLKQTIIN